MREIYSYLLLVRCDKNFVVETRGKRIFNISAGSYIYVGSCGINCSRVLRYIYSMRWDKKFWHIDYLLDKCSLERVLVIPNINEKDLARELSTEEFLEPVPRFGSSDDPSSRSHLFKIRNLDTDIIDKILERIIS